MDTDDDDAATLRERVRELEQTVAKQQDTIQQLMPSRRAILAGGAGLVGGAALTGQASAQSAAGQVGTSSEPVDVQAFDVTVQNGLDMADNPISNVDSLTSNSVNTDHLRTWDNINRPSRSYETEYQNTTGTDIYLKVLSESSSDGTRINTELRVGPSSALTGDNIVDKAHDTFDTSNEASVEFIIPDGYYYIIATAGDTDSFSINSWVELQ